MLWPFLLESCGSSLLGAVLQHEGYLEVDLVACDVALLDQDVHVLNPGALNVAQALVGPIEGFPYGCLKAIRGNGAYLVDARYAHACISPSRMCDQEALRYPSEISDQRSLVGADVRLGDDPYEPLALHYQDAVQLMLVHQLTRLVYVLVRPDSDEFACCDVLYPHRVRVATLGNHPRDYVAVGNHCYGALSLHYGQRSLLRLDHLPSCIHYAGAGLDCDHAGDHQVPYLRHLPHPFCFAACLIGNLPLCA